MKILSICFCAFLLIGCASSHPSVSLTAEQAKILVVQLANDKALTDYHCQPFRDGQPAHFVVGRWIWTEQQGYGLGDIQANVELASDGSTHNVELQLLDGRPLIPTRF